ncbi:VWD domain-containing protein, partial [Salmonella sp. s55004]|uniref:VWD domain-containing protein n=1 Tax=Salmonella sp. s55004 TaxID=3159675 RepID=UPI00397F5190
MKIEVGAEYYHKLCGMCGTCNKDVTDEFTLPTNNLAPSASEFGNSWENGDNECAPGIDENPCVPDSEEERQAEIV